ncbi:hypothetical protein [Candidatus Ichthyocystis hellenicum]|nr:hypothetical protein [Candidatus Ichthyocystis hellenicum]
MICLLRVLGFRAFFFFAAVCDDLRKPQMKRFYLEWHGAVTMFR